jgi:hypothetical protein
MVLLAAGWLVSADRDATAQGRPAGAPAPTRAPLRPGSIELDAGALWLSGIDFGSTTASIIGNQTPTTSYPLFETASEIKPAPAIEARLGWRMTRLLGIEGAFRYSRPVIETRISGDVENASSVAATNALSQYVVEISGVVYLTRFRIGKHGSPFVLGGAGYMRELDDAKALVQTGWLYHAGGGFKYLFSERTLGLVRGLGVRADARVNFKDGGYDLGQTSELRRFFAGGASLIVAF